MNEYSTAIRNIKYLVGPEALEAVARLLQRPKLNAVEAVAYAHQQKDDLKALNKLHAAGDPGLFILDLMRVCIAVRTKRSENFQKHYKRAFKRLDAMNLDQFEYSLFVFLLATWGMEAREFSDKVPLGKTYKVQLQPYRVDPFLWQTVCLIEPKLRKYDRI